MTTTPRMSLNPQQRIVQGTHTDQEQTPRIVQFTKNIINVLNCTNFQGVSAKEVKTMCQQVVQEAKVPEIASKDIRQSLFTLMPENTQGQVGLPDKVTVITSNQTELSNLGNPIMHFNWEGDTPQVTELTTKGTILLTADPILCRQDQPVHIKLEGTHPRPRVIQTIEEGYIISLIFTPVQQSQPHPLHFSTKNAELLKEEIKQLLQKQAVQEASPNRRGFFSNMFMVHKKDRGQRPVINLKQLNKFVKLEHFKMTTCNS